MNICLWAANCLHFFWRVSCTLPWAAPALLSLWMSILRSREKRFVIGSLKSKRFTARVGLWRQLTGSKEWFWRKCKPSHCDRRFLVLMWSPSLLHKVWNIYSRVSLCLLSYLLQATYVFFFWGNSKYTVLILVVHSYCMQPSVANLAVSHLRDLLC